MTTYKDITINGILYHVARFPGDCFYARRLTSSGAFVYFSEFSANSWDDAIRILTEGEEA